MKHRPLTATRGERSARYEPFKRFAIHSKSQPQATQQGLMPNCVKNSAKAKEH